MKIVNYNIFSFRFFCKEILVETFYNNIITGSNFLQTSLFLNKRFVGGLQFKRKYVFIKKKTFALKVVADIILISGVFFMTLL